MFGATFDREFALAGRYSRRSGMKKAYLAFQTCRFTQGDTLSLFSAFAHLRQEVECLESSRFSRWSDWGDIRGSLIDSASLLSCSATTLIPCPDGFVFAVCKEDVDILLWDSISISGFETASLTESARTESLLLVPLDTVRGSNRPICFGKAAPSSFNVLLSQRCSFPRIDAVS